MSKFTEHFGEEPDPNWRPEEGHHERWLIAKAAWNARGKVDKERCLAYQSSGRFLSDYDQGIYDAKNECAEAIEQENERE